MATDFFFFQMINNPVSLGCEMFGIPMDKWENKQVDTACLYVLWAEYVTGKGMMF